MWLLMSFHADKQLSFSSRRRRGSTFCAIHSSHLLKGTKLWIVEELTQNQEEIKVGTSRLPLAIVEPIKEIGRASEHSFETYLASEENMMGQHISISDSSYLERFQGELECFC